MPPIPLAARRALVALGALSGAALLSYGCGTDAVGIDACRTIEEARCDAAPACTGDDDTFGIRTEEQVENCKALYRDQCLHGLENAGSDDEDGNEPSDGNINKCVKAIKATATCKRNQDATLDDKSMEATCPEVAVVAGWGDKTPCQTLNEVENLVDCGFVAKDNEDDGTTAATTDTTVTTTGSGGAGGSGGSGG